MCERGKLLKDSQHEVLLPAGQVAPDSNGCALHILNLESHISVKLFCKEKKTEKKGNPETEKFDFVFEYTSYLTQFRTLSSDIYKKKTPPPIISMYLGLTLGSIQLGFLHCGNTERDMVTHRNTICFMLTCPLFLERTNQGGLQYTKIGVR